MPRRSLASLVLFALAAALTLAPTGHAEAQTTYQDSTGLTWSIATIEVGLLATVGGVAAADSSSATTVAYALLGLTALAAGVTAGVAQATNAPVEPPMVFHHAFIAAALLGGTVSFALTEAGETGDARLALGIAALVLGAAGMGTYSVLRMDRLAHDPQLVEEAHVLSWVPVASAALFGAIFGAAMGESGVLVGAIAGLVGLGISIAFVEVAIAENPPPMEMTMPLTEQRIPLGGWGGTF
ncbi:MAG: hypothetical protein AB7S26_35840 [Sandaracinaceae bacterium]